MESDGGDGSGGVQGAGETRLQGLTAVPDNLPGHRLLRRHLSGKYLDMIRRDYPPGLLVILPGMMGLRGNVFGSMASRFSTMLYLGDLEPSLREKKVLKHIVIAMMLSLIPVTILWAIGIVSGIKYHAPEILLIVIGSTILVSLILGYFTGFVTIFAFRREVDPPDSMAAPPSWLHGGPSDGSFSRVVHSPAGEVKGHVLGRKRGHYLTVRLPDLRFEG